METVETRVLKSSFSGIKGAKKERKLLEESSTSYLELKKKLELPDWCGENLDALWDALTGIMYTPAEISIKKTTAWKEIQEHANSIVDTMHEAETLYHEISVTVVD